MTDTELYKIITEFLNVSVVPFARFSSYRDHYFWSVKISCFSVIILENTLFIIIITITIIIIMWYCYRLQVTGFSQTLIANK